MVLIGLPLKALFVSCTPDVMTCISIERDQRLSGVVQGVTGSHLSLIFEDGTMTRGHIGESWEPHGLWPFGRRLIIRPVNPPAVQDPFIVPTSSNLPHHSESTPNLDYRPRVAKKTGLITRNVYFSAQSETLTDSPRFLDMSLALPLDYKRGHSRSNPSLTISREQPESPRSKTPTPTASAFGIKIPSVFNFLGELITTTIHMVLWLMRFKVSAEVRKRSAKTSPRSRAMELGEVLSLQPPSIPNLHQLLMQIALRAVSLFLFLRSWLLILFGRQISSSYLAP